MPFALLIVGTLLLVSGVRGTSGQLATLVKQDFTGSGNFIYWIVAILILGAIGYSDELKPLSRIFTVLVIVVLFLSNGGFFQQFTSALGTVNASSTGVNTSSSLVPPSPSVPSFSTLEPSTSSLSELL